MTSLFLDSGERVYLMDFGVGSSMNRDLSFYLILTLILHVLLGKSSSSVRVLIRDIL